MKTNKIYKLIFDEIIKTREFQTQFEVDDDYVFITPNSFYGFVLRKKGIPFNLEMIKKRDYKIDLLSIVKPENLLRKTNHCVMLKHQGLINIFRNNEREVFINSKFLSYFEDFASFYQDKDLSICVVVENGQVVGAVCPIKYYEEQE